MYQNLKTTLLSCMLLLTTNLFAQNKSIPSDDYDKLWKQVEEFNKDGLPQSALKVTEQIYTLALSENNEKQIIKSNVHRMSYIKALEVEGIKNSVLKLESEMLNCSGIVKPFMHLLLAKMYQEYFSYNSYQINQQSVTYNFDNKDIATWDKTKFQNKIIQNSLLSIDDILKKDNITEYSEFIQEAKESADCFPTLYDFVAFYATNQLSTEIGNNRFGDPNNNDKFKDNTYLSDLNTFVKLQLVGDTLSYKMAALKMYQKWLQFRLENSKNIEALVNTDLQRLSFVYENLTTSDKEKIWENALIALQKEYYNVPELAQINHTLANYYNNLGNSYNFQDSTTYKYKSHKIKAIELLKDVITRFPDARYAPACINLKNEIEKMSFSFEAEKIANANEKMPVRITFCNTNEVYLTVLKCDYDKFLNINNNSDFETYFQKLLAISEKIDNKRIELPKENDYNKHSTEYLSENLPFGFYVLLLHKKNELKFEENYFAYTTLFSSELCMLIRDTHYGNSSLYVFNRITGLPVEKAKVEVFTKDYDSKQNKYVYKKENTLYTDKAGYINVNTASAHRWSKYYRVDVSYKDDFISDNSSFATYSETKVQKRIEINFFTDRAIYRPGQTVHFKGVCLEKKGDAVKLLPKHAVKVDFKDVNWQNVSSLDLTSNEYGTISGSFTIPTGVLTGNFVINTSNGSHYIQVEEYKRPMFEVKMLPVEGEYRINDNVKVEGTATTYAGTALTDAKVSFTVARNPLWTPWYARWGMPHFGAPVEIAFGDVSLDHEGKFSIEFKALVDEIELLKPYLAYNYTVNVLVTDINGETQTTSTSFFVANRALELSNDINLYLIREQVDSISIISQNVSGVFLPANVEITVYKLKDNETILAKKTWGKIDMPLYSKNEWYKAFPGYEYNDETDFSKFEIERAVFQRKINTKDTKKIKLDGSEKWAPGVYRMGLKSVDKWGNPVENVKEFVLFSEKDKKMPTKLTDFFYIDKTSAQPGETVNLFVGSSYKDVHIFYDLEAQGKTAKTETIKLSAEIKKIEIPILESYRGNITVNLVFVKNGRFYHCTQTINVDWENKKLDIKFITFRDKTLPGANESWKLKISDHLSQPATAEFMASLYDASLDFFAKNSWNLNPFPTYYSKLNWNNFGFGNLHSTERDSIYFVPLQMKVSYPYLKLFDIYASYYGMQRKFRNVEYSEMVVPCVSPIFSQDNTTSSSKLTGGEKGVVMESSMEVFDAAVGGGTPPPPIQIRSNFTETAFFYPILTTDESGEIFLNFTMPESLTRWNFMGLAHTKDLKIGTITEEIVTQKELMVMPNLPRFFRENDKIIISTKINNVSESDIAGKATINFFDVENLKSLNLKFLNSNVSKEFNVPKAGNTLVEWQITIPEGLSAVGIRIIAEGKNHSDGEERILPILSNKMLVTESKPLPVRKSGKTNFTLNSLVNNKSTTLRNESFTLEFTANPAWYAVQALPYLMEYPYECAEQVFSRFYANSLSSHIANSDPKIKRVFELWKTIPESNALLSNLEKNQELKALLIEETPWLLNAKNENERKQKLGILFDLNRMANENNRAIKKLSEMQKSNGGFPWFKDMSENWYITQHIVGGFAHLDKLGVTEARNNQIVWNMVQKAIQFIDGELEKSYTNLKKHCDAKCLEKDNLGYLQAHYLYVRSFFINEIPVPKTSVDAFNYYKEQAIKYWTTKDFYTQGMIGLALYKYGEPKIPAKIVASLKERAIQNEEMGMYWKYNSGYYWYQAPIETQALLIELFTDVANDKTSVEEMKVWLLKQKQTQDWKTTKATTEAIYALLLQGANLLAETDYPTIKIGDMTIDVAADHDIKTEAGTGYFKKRWDGTLVNPDWGKVSVTKKENSVAWGAVYWQYFELLDKIKHFEETPLEINKQLFVERRVEGKTVIVPIEKDAQLQIGDKVTVRIEIRSDRDMEYVHLKDMRAACFEPIENLSGYRWKAGFGYYQAIKDASMNFFIDYLRKGTYVFEYTLRVSQKGEFSNGITTIQSMYAPEFTSHSQGVRVVVSE